MRSMEDEQKSLRTKNGQLKQDLEEQGRQLHTVQEERGRYMQEANQTHDQVCVC